MTTEHKKFVENSGRCELCGSKRNLQLHHMIPMVCEPDREMNLLKKPIKLDVEDNWICVCGSCHAKLTPRNLLTKYALNKRKGAFKIYSTGLYINEQFCRYIQKLIDAGERIQIDDYFDGVEYACGVGKFAPKMVTMEGE